MPLSDPTTETDPTCLSCAVTIASYKIAKGKSYLISNRDLALPLEAKQSLLVPRRQRLAGVRMDELSPPPAKQQAP